MNQTSRNLQLCFCFLLLAVVATACGRADVSAYDRPDADVLATFTECDNAICESGEDIGNCPEDCPADCLRDEVCAFDEAPAPKPTPATKPAPATKPVIVPKPAVVPNPAPSVSSCGDGVCCQNKLCGVSENSKSCANDCGSCGDGVCALDEGLRLCAADCGRCGDGVCSSDEDLSSCAVDCGYCGDKQCVAPERAVSCARDCDRCGDSYCSELENAVTCPTTAESVATGGARPAKLKLKIASRTVVPAVTPFADRLRNREPALRTARSRCCSVATRPAPLAKRNRTARPTAKALLRCHSAETVTVGQAKA